MLSFTILFLSFQYFSKTRIPIIEANIEPSITFISIPYPVTQDAKKKHKSVRRQNIVELYLLTMSSWLSTTKNSKILFLIPQKEFDKDNLIVPFLEEKFGPNRLLFIPDDDRVEGDEDDVPFIDDWFVKGFDYVTKHNLSDMICFINSDIITPNGWYERSKQIFYFFKHIRQRQMAIISRRCDFDYKFTFDSINATNLLQTVDYDEISKEKRTHSPWGVDFYLISMDPMEINIDEIPPFHMGKYRWDPWVTGWLNSNIELVSMGDSFCTYHVNHPPKPRNMEDPKVKENFEIAARNGRFNAGNHQAKYKLSGKTLFKGNEPIFSLPQNIPPDNSPKEENSIS